MSPATASIPAHLKKYVVSQNYQKYTDEDQAVWRFIMRQLKDFLSMHAHPAYVDGLKRTGIEVESIPRIEVMDQKLAEFGWGAVPVSGFIPPAAFMEFQSLGILPIASDMRSINHLTYTPAPDIVHEAAGHAPILIDPQFASYLKKYAEIARNAIVSKLDHEQYAAIRDLSDIKENPDSSPQDIAAANDRLNEVNRKLTSISEAGWLSRMNWWTAEYGLIGSLEKPQIFGAGLLSSVGEARLCLSERVKKIPLSVDCIEVGYDITEPQPQLFVTPDFATLHRVVDELADKMAFRLGGRAGLERAIQSETVNTIQLDSGLQISGVVSEFKSTRPHQVDWFRLSGPCALACNHSQIQGHGKDFHSHGFSSPIGKWKGVSAPPQSLTDADLERYGLRMSQIARLEFESGVVVSGKVSGFHRDNDKLLMISWRDAQVTWGSHILFEPSWGQFDMAVGTHISSVFGGPADRLNFGEVDDFVSAQVPARRYSKEQHDLFGFYRQIRDLRSQLNATNMDQWLNLKERYLQNYSNHWLPAIELIEMAYTADPNHLAKWIDPLVSHLKANPTWDKVARECLESGLKTASLKL